MTDRTTLGSKGKGYFLFLIQNTMELQQCVCEHMGQKMQKEIVACSSCVSLFGAVRLKTDGGLTVSCVDILYKGSYMGV